MCFTLGEFARALAVGDRSRYSVILMNRVGSTTKTSVRISVSREINIYTSAVWRSWKNPRLVVYVLHKR